MASLNMFVFVVVVLASLAASAVARAPTTRRLSGGGWRLDVPKASLEKLLQERFVGQSFDGVKLKKLSLSLSSSGLELLGVVHKPWVGNIDVVARAEPAVSDNQLHASYHIEGRGVKGSVAEWWLDGHGIPRSGLKQDLLRMVSNEHASAIPNGQQVVALLQAMHKGTCALDGVVVNEHGLQLDCTEVSKLDL